ncbi:MAG: glycosyltransferase, partial [Kiloniellales bacterium]
MTGTAATALSLLAAAVWFYLLAFHGRFWRADQRLDHPDRAADAAPARWPSVVAVVPARNEAEALDRSLASLLAQKYPGSFSVILVDDHSEDDTAEVARLVTRRAGASDRLMVVRADSLPRHWTGKLWAMENGVRRAAQAAPGAEYLLFTDADIEHDPGVLEALVRKAESGGLDLVSLMALLRCRGPWEWLLLPAFVLFFQKLYPFPWVNDPKRRTAGAAGGCMLVRRGALERAGGLAAIRGEIIDDCALARMIKRQGPIWLGLTRSVRSVRPYGGLSGVWRMVARTAYAQLGYAPLPLLGAVLGMSLVYLVPPPALVLYPLHGAPAAALFGL